MMGLIRASLVLILLFAVLDCTSQVQPVPVRVDPAGENTAVQLSSLDADSEAAFAKFFRSPADQAFRPYSLLLKNNSGKPIIGIALIWTVTTPEVVRKYECRFETSNGALPGASFATIPVPLTPEEIAARRAERLKARMNGETPGPRVQVSKSGASFQSALAAGANMVVAPDRFTLANGQASGGGPAGMFSTATDISVLVDAVVLVDGLVLGSDQSGTLDALNARNAAVEALLTAVRTAKEKGEDPIPKLEELSEGRLRSRDPVARTESMMANILLHSTDWEKQFAVMEQTELINYHR